MSMHHRDTQTSNATSFVPKSHSAVLLREEGAYGFTDRQGVAFSVTVAAAKIPFYLPVSVNTMTAAPSADGAIFLA